MKQFKKVKALLMYISAIADSDYYEGFYNMPYFSKGASMEEDGVIFGYTYCPFYGGMAPKDCVDFLYEGTFFQVSEIDSHNVHLAFGKSIRQFTDQLWCIDLPITRENFLEELCRIAKQRK